LLDSLNELGNILQKVIIEGRSVVANNLESHPGNPSPPADCPHFKAFLASPLKYAGQSIGLIALGNKEGGFDATDQETLENLSFAIVEALLRKRGEAALKQAHDELEWRVEERTADLKMAVDQLQEEVMMRQQVEEELRLLNEELEERVRERTAELEAANRELEAFSYSVAHDLQSPLRAIEGFSRMLSGEQSDKLDAEGLRLLQVICDNTKLMHRLIEDLLALARLGRQQMRKSLINLGAMAGQVFHRLQAETKGRDLQLTLNDLPPACGDYSLLNQVMTNLLANAVKFTRSRETAAIEVGGWIEGTENIYFIKDNGIGFDMRFGDKIYGVFQRLHNGEGYEGTGIGLAIVQRIIHRHGGRVWAEGKINEGATFYFALPKNGECQT
jgi:signal transduction histidine kinase